METRPVGTLFARRIVDGQNPSKSIDFDSSKLASCRQDALPSTSVLLLVILSLFLCQIVNISFANV